MKLSKIKYAFFIVLISSSLFGCASVLRISIPDNTPTPPLKIDAFEKLEPIVFEKGIITLTRGTEIGSGGMTLNYGGDDIKIESGESSALCTYRSNKIFWDTGSAQFSGQEGEFNEVFYKAMKSAGYDVIGDPKIVFEKEEERSRATFKIAARVTDLKANICEMGHWWDGRPLGIHAGEVYLAVEWSVYSTLARKTILSIQTTSYKKAEDAVAGGFSLLLLGGFESAVKELAFNKEFYNLISNKTSHGDVTPHKGNEIVISNRTPYTSNVINNRIENFLQGTVTVRTGNSHGSGFLIDETGLILTNAHVVGGSEKAVIIFNSGIEVKGTVKRVNKLRDIALIKVDVGGLKALPIRITPVNTTEEVYAIGTPLKEGLKSTITKGIISAIRTQEDTGLQYIQSDVDIQAGNSGGPLLDEKGNVIGIAVAGYGVKGFSVGVNLFIPILDALHWLNVKISKEN